MTVGEYEKAIKEVNDEIAHTSTRLMHYKNMVQKTEKVLNKQIEKREKIITDSIPF